jgi:hypothetical protein
LIDWPQWDAARAEEERGRKVLRTAAGNWSKVWCQLFGDSARRLPGGHALRDPLLDFGL